MTADVVEIQEFPELASAYNVMGVPMTVMNDTVQFTGAVTEEVLTQRILEAVGIVESDADQTEQVSERTTSIA